MAEKRPQLYLVWQEEANELLTCEQMCTPTACFTTQGRCVWQEQNEWRAQTLTRRCDGASVDIKALDTARVVLERRRPGRVAVWRRRKQILTCVRRGGGGGGEAGCDEEWSEWRFDCSQSDKTVSGH
jgi:hypothetical protein